MDGDRSGLAPVTRAELTADAGDVVVDRARADAERFGDLQVGPALDEEEEDLPLPRGEALAGERSVGEVTIRGWRVWETEGLDGHRQLPFR
jgi:hypothetical protein